MYHQSAEAGPASRSVGILSDVAAPSRVEGIMHRRGLSNLKKISFMLGSERANAFAPAPHQSMDPIRACTLLRRVRPTTRPPIPCRFMATATDLQVCNGNRLVVDGPFGHGRYSAGHGGAAAARELIATTIHPVVDFRHRRTTNY